MRRTSGHGRPLRACAQQGLRSAMPTASRFWRSFRAHSGHYVSERIAKRCRCGGATHASHGWPWKATQGLRVAGTAQRNAAAGASLVRQAPRLAGPVERDGLRVQERALQAITLEFGIALTITIFVVTQQRVAGERCVHADLM